MQAARNHDGPLMGEDYIDDQSIDFVEEQSLPPKSAGFATDSVRILIYTALAAVVLAGGLFSGRELRRRRLGYDKFHPLNPYVGYEEDTGTEYEAIGI